MKQIKLEINVSITGVFSHKSLEPSVDGMREDGWWKMIFDESDEISPSKETHNDGLEGLIKIENLCLSFHPFEQCIFQDVNVAVDPIFKLVL